MPVPAEAERVLNAVVGSVLLHSPGRAGQYQLALGGTSTSELHRAWDAAVDREKEALAYFRQSAIEPGEVAQEVEATDDVLGDPDAVRRFLAEALPRFNGYFRAHATRKGVFTLGLGELNEHLPTEQIATGELDVVLDRLADFEAVHIGRTHPLIAVAADAVIADAFEAEHEPRFARAGAMLTRAVERVTAVLLLRFRYTFEEEAPNFAEEVRLVACERRSGALVPIEPLASAARALLEQATPAGNFARDGAADMTERRRHVQDMLDRLGGSKDWWRPLVEWRKGELEAAHGRLRKITREQRLKVVPHPPPDIMACFVLVPAGGNGT